MFKSSEFAVVICFQDFNNLVLSHLVLLKGLLVLC